MKISEKRLMAKVDRGEFHCLPASSLGPRESNTANRLVLRGWLRRLPARGRWAERFVVTTNGSYAMGIFLFARMYPTEAEAA